MNDDIRKISVLAGKLKDNIQKVIVGKNDVAELMLTALIAGGHVLLEDVPGTGKTVLAKSLAKSLSCGFSRIQFTPDLLPADVTGMSVFNQKTSEFEYRMGPVFTNILLADEINRATPRTQSALLECMEEGQVTADGVTRTLEKPFMVLATQNPVEIQGTFPLPEAQLDRFLVRLKMGYPSSEESVAIMERFMRDDPLSELAPVAAAGDVIDARAIAKTVRVSGPVCEYIVALAERSRAAEGVMLGVSPRGMLAMMRAAQAYAAIRGRDFVTPDDIKTLAMPVMAHRVIARGGYGKAAQSEAVVSDILKSVPVPTESPSEWG